MAVHGTCAMHGQGSFDMAALRHAMLRCAVLCCVSALCCAMTEHAALRCAASAQVLPDVKALAAAGTKIWMDPARVGGWGASRPVVFASV